MERKEWLETFLWLADNNRPAIEYRKRLGVKHNKLPVIIKKIPAFRKELADILAAEQAEKDRAELVKKLKEERKKLKDEQKKSSAARRKAVKSQRSRTLLKHADSEETRGSTSGDNTEAVGTREDNPEE